MKVENLFKVESLTHMKDSFQRADFKDSAAGIVLGVSLIAVDPEIFKKQFPKLTFVNSGITVNNYGGFARYVESLRLTPQGGFVDADDLSSAKGKISLKGENDLIKVYRKQAFSEWTDTEIQEANLQNINLVSNFVETHNELYLQMVDSIGYIGQNTNTGLLNNTYFGTGVASGYYYNMTPLELYNTVAEDTIVKQWNLVKNIVAYKANIVTMPIEMLNYLSTQILNTTHGSATVLRALQDNFAGVKFTDTVYATTSMVAWSTNRQSMQMRITEPLTVGEIIKTGSFTYKMDSKFSIAGLDILQKDAGYILTGVAA
jgi:hypothetical protein